MYEAFHQLPHLRFRYNFGRLSLLPLSKAWGSVPVLGASLRALCLDVPPVHHVKVFLYDNPR